MIAFLFREDEEAEDEENGASRERTNVYVINDAVRESWATRDEQSRHPRMRVNRSRIQRRLRLRRETGIFCNPEKGVTSTTWCGRQNGHASPSASADDPASFWFCYHAWLSSPSTSFPTTATNSTYSIRPSSRIILRKVRTILISHDSLFE